MIDIGGGGAPKCNIVLPDGTLLLLLLLLMIGT
jgi:hypothetical protein